MQTSAENLLLKLYQRKKLAPFYIIRGPISSTHCPLLEWAQDFSAQLLELHKSISLEQAREQIQMGHQDLLFITKEADEKNLGEDLKSYKVDDPHMRDYFKAVQYPPMDLCQKFIFIDKGQLIGDYFANKWLKTLEEPAENVTTIFLVETQSPLLNTIESRAITLRIQRGDPGLFYHCPLEHEDFTTFLTRCAKEWDIPKGARKKIDDFSQNSNQYHLLLDALREYPALRTAIYTVMNDYMLAPNHTIHAQQHWLEEIQWFHKAHVFNNSTSERFFGLLRCVIESTAHKVLID